MRPKCECCGSPCVRERCDICFTLGCNSNVHNGTCAYCGRPSPHNKCDACARRAGIPEVSLEEWEKARKSLEVMIKELTCP